MSSPANARFSKPERFTRALVGVVVVIAIHNGLNTFDVDSDGRPDTIVVGYRENYNAHSFEVTTIFVWADSATGQGVQLQIVPLESKNEDEKDSGPYQLELRAGGGADGLLEDFRLFVDAVHHRAVLIHAKRQFGSSFADSQPVAFEYSELTRNTEGLPGLPTLYFHPYKNIPSRKTYVDVAEAFSSELGLETDGRGAH